MTSISKYRDRISLSSRERIFKISLTVVAYYEACRVALGSSQIAKTNYRDNATVFANPVDIMVFHIKI